MNVSARCNLEKNHSKCSFAVRLLNVGHKRETLRIQSWVNSSSAPHNFVLSHNTTEWKQFAKRTNQHRGVIAVEIISPNISLRIVSLIISTYTCAGIGVSDLSNLITKLCAIPLKSWQGTSLIWQSNLRRVFSDFCWFMMWHEFTPMLIKTQNNL